MPIVSLAVGALFGPIIADDKSDQLFMLEVNTQPGMTATSLVPEQARFVGMSVKNWSTIFWRLRNATIDWLDKNRKAALLNAAPHFLLQRQSRLISLFLIALAVQLALQ